MTYLPFTSFARFPAIRKKTADYYTLALITKVEMTQKSQYKIVQSKTEFDTTGREGVMRLLLNFLLQDLPVATPAGVVVLSIFVAYLWRWRGRNCDLR